MLGPPALPEIEKASRDTGGTGTTPAEPQEKLQDIVQTLQDESHGDIPVEHALLGGRFKPAPDIACFPRRLDGQIRLYTSECEDMQEHKQLGPTYLIATRDGVWSAAPLPKSGQNPDADWILQNAARGYEDVLGNIWTGDWKDRMITPEFKLVSQRQPGDEWGLIDGSDREGRIFLRTTNNQLMIFDRRVNTPAGALSVEAIKAEAVVASGIDQPGAGWLRNGDGLTHLSADGTLHRVALPQGYSAESSVPLRGDAVLAWLHTTGANSEQSPWVYDGKTWKQEDGSTVQNLVHDHAAELAALLGTDCSPRTDAPRELWRLASDGGQGLWFQGYHIEQFPGPIMQQAYRYDMKYFDGKAWHDVWPDVTRAEPSIARMLKSQPDVGLKPVPRDPAEDWEAMGTVENGSIMLAAFRPTGDVVSIGGSVNQLPVHRLRQKFSPIVNPIARLDAAGGKAFFCVGRDGSTTVYAYGNGELVALSPHNVKGTPQLADTDGRIWFTTNSSVMVIDDHQQFSATVPTANDKSHILQAPDGRIWVIDSDGICQLKYKGGVINVGTHYKWDTAKNELSPWIDGSGKLWLSASGGTVGKVSLPD